MMLRLSHKWDPPEEGGLLVAALADETYAVLQRVGDHLLEVLSGDVVSPVEVVAAAELEVWPFGQVRYQVGDEVMCEMGSFPVNGRPPRVAYAQGRVLHTIGEKAWVRLTSGEDALLRLSRLRPIE